MSYVCCILARYCIRWGRIYIDFDSIKRALKADALQIVNTVKKPAAAGAFEYNDSLANEVADGLPKYWPRIEDAFKWNYWLLTLGKNRNRSLCLICR